jgi:hypothetical protein
MQHTQDRNRLLVSLRRNAASFASIACLWIAIPALQAQTNKPNPAETAPSAILTAQLPDSGEQPANAAVAPRAGRLYHRAVHELHRGKSAAAEKDALRAVHAQPDFADGYALAATAALAQGQFNRAHDEATKAIRISSGNEKSWVILATADNYLARYTDAATALEHVGSLTDAAWQPAYQWARAEAGLGNGAAVLDWANRAAVSAPAGFAPLHLLRASALLAAQQYSQSADELETYLSLTTSQGTQQTELRSELRRIRGLALQTTANNGAAAEPNALAN